MTRETDHFLSLKDRADYINSKNLDLVISIHANSSPKKLKSGTEIFVSSSSSEAVKSKALADK